MGRAVRCAARARPALGGRLVLTISSGHSASYLTEAVAAGRENYYTGAVTAGEPPGRWYGRGAAVLGLAGEVASQDMTALYERFLDPRDPAFRDPSRWDEAATLGHTGRRYPTEEQLYAAALAAEPGADPERRAELRFQAGKRAPKNVAFLDATFSVQKSVTVLHTAFEAQEVQAAGAAGRAREALAGAVQSGDAGAVRRHSREVAEAEAAEAAWAEHRRAVEDAIWAGNHAALDYLADKAGYARVGHHGGAAGRWVDAHDWTIASFFQHESRNHDPQLHIHNAILNRVQSSDGTWRTVDSRAIHKYRGAASAVGERVMEEHLTRTLGVRLATRPDGNAREVVGIDQKVMDLFSSRRRAITAKTKTLVAAFDAQFGRAPNSLELDRLQRSATFATRHAKSHHGETVTERLDRWDVQLRAEVHGGLARVAANVLNQAQADQEPSAWSVSAVIETALADVQESKAAWTAPDLTRALSNALPDHLGHLSAGQVSHLLDGLTAEALKLAVPLDASRPGDASLPDDLRLANGTSAYQAPGGRLYATPDHLDNERLLAAATMDRHAPNVSHVKANAFIADLAGHGVELDADQAAAVRGILTSGAQVETLVGPAGTGKSFAVAVLAKAWQDPALWAGEPRRAVGLAASQIATEVLNGEGLDARNVARWLATQERLTMGAAQGDDLRWRLRVGDLVVVDESAMANTADLVRIHAYCREAGAKLLLTGDHHQLAAVGAAGGMDLVAATGARHELAETRRFTHAWEGAASLRLRERDQTVLADYHKHGRLLDGGALDQAEAAAARAWVADTLAGRQALLIVDTNEQVARLSAQLRADLVRLGRVDDQESVPLGLQGTWAGVGDIVQARRNGWHLAGYHGNRRGPINREQYRVTAIREDGRLEVTSILGHTDQIQDDRIVLPAAYVAEHLALGYATTVHAAQGLTVDTCHTVVTQSTAAEALYVGMTRGRQANTAHVVTRAVPAEAPPGSVLTAVHRSPAVVLAGVFETSDPQRSALAQAVESAAEAESVRSPAELFADASQLATASRTASWLDQLVNDGHLTPDQRIALAVEDGATTLTGLLRRVELAGHDPKQALTNAVAQRSLDDARQITSVLHSRISDRVSLDPLGDTFADWTPTVDDPQWQTYLTTLAGAADDRRRDLGRKTATDAPIWAVEAFGVPPAPDRAEERAAWEDRAASVATYREMIGHDEKSDPLGQPPKPGQAETYAAWRAAWRALGRPEADVAEAEMSTGQLRVRIRAYEREKSWAPDHVANQLAETRQAADKHRHDATLWSAQAATTSEHDAARLRDETADSDALAKALDDRASELAEADEARAAWYAHTAATRAAAERAAAELTARQADMRAELPPITAEEWLTAHDAEAKAEDPYRRITNEHDLADVVDRRVEDQQEVDHGKPLAQSPEPDIREATAAEGTSEKLMARNRAADEVRAPTADETAESVRRAQRALQELKHRQAADARHTEDEAREEVSRWHADQQSRTPQQRARSGPANHEEGHGGVVRDALV
jgi:hypothetical protein